MPRGKKYNAAEKHFLKQKEALDKQLLASRNLCGIYDSKIRRLEKELAEAKGEITRLTQENDTLKELHGLSQSDVRELIRKAEGINAIHGVFKFMGGYT